MRKLCGIVRTGRGCFSSLSPVGRKVLDVRRGTVKATRDLVAFLAYVSFFPLLVAGPIERATNLLPQFLKPRRFDCDAALQGVCLFCCGLFKKSLR